MSAQAPRVVLLLDTGKEWGGGTNSMSQIGDGAAGEARLEAGARCAHH